MKTRRLKLSQTQALALQQLNDPTVVELLFGGGAGGSKALRHGTKVATPFGFRKVEDLKVGQSVIGGDGRATTVIAKTYQGMRPIRRVQFSDGASIDVDSEHLWAYCFARKGGWEKSGKSWKVGTTEQIQRAMARGRRVLIPLTAPVAFTKSYKVNMRPIDPYVLGVLLGDGCLQQKNVSFTSIDPEVVDMVKRRAPGYWNQQGISFYARGELRLQLLGGLGRLGLNNTRSNNKFIPESYKYAPIEERWELLRGLMDTDGTCASGKLYYTSISERLAKDVQFVVRSLGGKATITSSEPVCVLPSGRRKICSSAYTVYIKFQDNREAFNLSRKKATAQVSAIVVKRRITSIEDVGVDNSTCIVVDNLDGLFVATDDFIVTHNSMIVCIWMILECRKYPGIRIGLGREELVRLEQTTLITLFSKAHPLLGIGQEDFAYNGQSKTVTYVNGSQIQCIGLSYEPRDPEYDRFGSSEYTHVVIEEVGETRKKGVDVFTSRKNRFLNREYGIVGKTVQTCNPSINWVREEWYEPYKALGMGRMQKWPHGMVTLPTDEEVQAYRAFIRSLVTDNPFADPNYIQTLKMLPTAERKRLYKGDWDFLSGDYLLFPDLIQDRAYVPELKRGRKVMGVDVADGGKDNSIITLVEEAVAVDQEEIPIDISPNLSPQDRDPAIQVGKAIIKYATQHDVKPTDIGIDGVGVGAGARAYLRSKGWFVEVFIGGESPTDPGFGTLRDEQYYQTSQDMQGGRFGVYSQIPTRTELRRQLRPHEYFNNGKVIKVTPKEPPKNGIGGDNIKSILGRSPDNADSFVIARWMWNHGNSNDAENHILF